MALSFVSLARTALAEEHTRYALSWSRFPGAEACPSPTSIARAVEARLGDFSWGPSSSADVVIEGHVDEAPGSAAWRARIVVSEAGGKILGHREITSEGPECSSLEKGSFPSCGIGLFSSPQRLKKTYYFRQIRSRGNRRVDRVAVLIIIRDGELHDEAGSST